MSTYIMTSIQPLLSYYSIYKMILFISRNIPLNQVVGPPQEFYKAALMYLAYTPIEDLSKESRYQLATDMALASITGEVSS